MKRSAYDLDSPREEATQLWRLQAACRDADPELFFTTSSGVGVNEPAKRICRACPVRVDCLTYALQVEGNEHLGRRFGVWGGLDRRERWTLWRCNTGRCRHPKHRQEAAA